MTHCMRLLRKESHSMWARVARPHALSVGVDGALAAGEARKRWGGLNRYDSF